MKIVNKLGFVLLSASFLFLGACNEDRDDGVIDWVRNGMDHLALRQTEGFALEFETSAAEKETFFLSAEGRKSLLVSELEVSDEAIEDDDSIPNTDVGAAFVWSGASNEEAPLIGLQLEGDTREYHFEVEAAGSLKPLSELNKLLADRHPTIDPLVLASGSVVYLNVEGILFYIFDLEKTLIDKNVTSIKKSETPFFDISYQKNLEPEAVYWSEAVVEFLDSSISSLKNNVEPSPVSEPASVKASQLCQHDSSLDSSKAFGDREPRLNVVAVCDIHQKPVDAWICSESYYRQPDCIRFIAPEQFELMDIVQDHDQSTVYVYGNWKQPLKQEKASDLVPELSTRATGEIVQKEVQKKEQKRSSLFVYSLRKMNERLKTRIEEREFAYPEKISSAMFLSFIAANDVQDDSSLEPSKTDKPLQTMPLGD